MTVAFSNSHPTLSMWFMEEPSQFSEGQTAHSLTCSIMEKPHTGLDDYPKILLSSFRKRMSDSHLHLSLASHSASVLNWNSRSQPTPQRHSTGPELEPAWLLRSRRHPLAMSSWEQQSLKSSERQK